MCLANQHRAKIQQFTKFVSDGVESWCSAGQIMAELVDDAGEEIYDIISAEIPGLHRETLELFTSIGRKQIYPLLAMDDSEGATMLAGLPYDEQERLYRDGVPLVEKTRDGWEVEIIPVRNLSRYECAQVFDDTRLRSEDEQRRYLEEVEAERRRKAAGREQRRHGYQKVNRGDMTGFDADKSIVRKSPVSLDKLNSATPLELLRSDLDQAHAAMMDARRHLASVKPNSIKDDLISHALNAIGKLRYAAANNEI